MMEGAFSRTALLIGEEGLKKLASARVAVFGVGGVGGYTVEALARSGVGFMDLIDDDKVSVSNINRQIIATTQTVGKYKVDVAKKRVLDINPRAVVHTHQTFYTPQTAGQFDFSQYDYVVDAIDTVTGKIELVMQAQAAKTKIISSMGAGNKLNPAAFEVADIYKTSVCPLARVMRQELRKRGVQHLKVVYSKEPPLTPIEGIAQAEEPLPLCVQGSSQTLVRKKQVPGSMSFVPSVAGLIIAGEIVRDLLTDII